MFSDFVLLQDPQIQAGFSDETATDASLQNHLNQNRMDCGLPEVEVAILRLKQVHSNRLYHVQASSVQHTFMREGDGYLTPVGNLALCIQTADCVPILAWCSPWIGAAHAGRKGIVQKIHVRLAEQLLEHSPEGTIDMVLGPHIGACCYEIDDSVIPCLLREALYPSSVGHYYFDMEQQIRLDLSSLPVRIASDSTCTLCGLSSRPYPSYRRKDTGRFISFIVRYE